MRPRAAILAAGIATAALLPACSSAPVHKVNTVGRAPVAAIPETLTTWHPTPPPTTPPTITPRPPEEAKAPSPPASASSGPPGSCGGLDELVARHFPPEARTAACSVIRCETAGTFDPTILNRSGSGAAGLFQFLPGTWHNVTGTPPPASAYPAETQIAAGAALWHTSGWAPWSCKP